MKMVKRLLIGIAVTLVLASPVFFLNSNVPSTEDYSDTTKYVHEYTPVQATVLSKEHTPMEIKRETRWTIEGTRLIPHIISPECNYVTVSYGDLTTTIDSLSLYDSVEVGSIINVTLHQIYDNNHNLVKQYLELPQ